MFWQVASGLVGLVFLVTGVLKALDSARFRDQILRYRLLPFTWVQPAAVLFIAFECTLGIALLLGLSAWLLPLAAVVLVGFAALTAWGTSSGRVEDCGCYGGLVMLTPAQSLALDAVYLVLLGAAWSLAPAEPIPPAVWKWVVVVAVLAASLVAAWRSLQKPLADLSLLRVGRTWRRRWLKHYARDVTQGSHFVVFLSRDCPYCKRWVPLLNVIEVQPDLPSVVAVMSLQGDELRAFLSEHLIAFPVTHMPQSLVSLMVDAYPTAALLENGHVKEKWIGEMPQSYVDRVRGFFDAIAVPVKRPRGGFAG
jgi:uncharacterized membrane protein YphA (DoxX/SURF4 family)